MSVSSLYVATLIVTGGTLVVTYILVSDKLKNFKENTRMIYGVFWLLLFFYVLILGNAHLSYLTDKTNYNFSTSVSNIIVNKSGYQIVYDENKAQESNQSIGVLHLRKLDNISDYSNLNKEVYTAIQEVLNDNDVLKLSRYYDYIECSSKETDLLSSKLMSLLFIKDFYDLNSVDCRIKSNTEVIKINGKLSLSVVSSDNDIDAPLIKYSIGDYTLVGFNESLSSLVNNDNIVLELSAPKDRDDKYVLNDYKVISATLIK